MEHDLPSTFASRRVLIIDRSDENRAVLRTLLERRGAEILESREAPRAMARAHTCHLDLIVMDLETLPPPGDDPAVAYELPAQSAQTPMVFLGTVPQTWRGDTRRTLAKPYHYARLIRTIEELIGPNAEPTPRGQ